MRKARPKKLKGKMSQRKGFGLKTNLDIGQLVKFKGIDGPQKGIVRCIHPFGKVGTVYVGDFNGNGGHIVPVEKVEIV